MRQAGSGADASGTSPDLVPGSCTPLRSSYVADLRNATLAASNLTTVPLKSTSLGVGKWTAARCALTQAPGSANKLPRWQHAPAGPVSCYGQLHTPAEVAVVTLHSGKSQYLPAPSSH